MNHNILFSIVSSLTTVDARTVSQPFQSIDTAAIAPILVSSESNGTILPEKSSV